MTKSQFWPGRPIVITMKNFQVEAGADLWVYNAVVFCVSNFNQVASIFHPGGRKTIKELDLHIVNV